MKEFGGTGGIAVLQRGVRERATHEAAVHGSGYVGARVQRAVVASQSGGASRTVLHENGRSVVACRVRLTEEWQWRMGGRCRRSCWHRENRWVARAGHLVHFRVRG